MVATFLLLSYVFMAIAADSTTAADSVAAASDSTLGRADSVAATDSTRIQRIVREFPALEVRALLHDLRSIEMVHPIPGQALRGYPVDGLAEIVALQPGVVAQGEELHVRGGRAGQTLVVLDGIVLNEPRRHRPLELPLLALRSVDLVSGAPESRFPGALAGILDLHTFDPGPRPEGEWRWQTDGGLDTRYDRLSARASAPLPFLDLGMVAAGDATLDDTWLPSLRSPIRHRVLGVPLGWRDDNRILGYLKLAPVAAPRAFSFQVLASRSVHKPYDPMWTLDGWVYFDSIGSHFSPDTLPGAVRYRAADHLAITDERRIGTLLTLASVRGPRRATLGLGWLRTRTASTVGGIHRLPDDPAAVLFGGDISGDPFHVFLGDDPLSRVSGSDVYSIRGDAERATAASTTIKVGAGATYEDVWMDELDGTLFGLARLDSLRTYHARAPGAFAYAEGRWQPGDMVVHAGLRAEYFTAGPQADDQTLPGSPRGTLSLSPRLGIAFPLSSRDVFSISYARARQDPERDLLYDRRRPVNSTRQPLGNPALPPEVMISYEGAVKHLFSAAWALQTSFFYRDLARVAGARSDTLASGWVDLIYTDGDQASTAGFGVSVIHAPDERRRFEAHYTIMRAWGFESRPEGDPYGPVRGLRTAPIGETPLSWDRRHSILLSGVWEWRKRLSLAWSSTIGSGLPWTPKPRREPLADVTVVNSRRFGWTETTNLTLRWSPPYALGLTFGLEGRNVFNTRTERAATVDGYPNPVINTIFDDYSAYRTETGLGGGAYWATASGTPHWVPVHDPRLFHPPRAVRASVGRSW